MVTPLPASMPEALWLLRLEHLWVGLVLIGVCSSRSWWVAVLLSAMGSVQIAAFYVLPAPAADLAAPFIELGAALVITRRTSGEAWATLIVWLFFASFALQATAAFFGTFGLSVDRALYLGANAIFTAQLACAAVPGGASLARSLHGFSRRRRPGDHGPAEYTSAFHVRPE